MCLREKVQKHPQPGRVPFTNKKHPAVSGVFLLPKKTPPGFGSVPFTKENTPLKRAGCLAKRKLIWRLPFWRERYHLSYLRNRDILFLF